MKLGTVISFILCGCLTTLCAGCATSLPHSDPAVAHWERRVLARGLELDVSEDAGPEARQIAEDFQAEMRSRYISARQ